MSCCHRLSAGVLGAALLLCTKPGFALEPPTREQVRQYQADGTWARRVAQARELGNDQTDPALVATARARLQRNAALAAGLPIADENAPPSAWRGGLPSKGTVKALVLLIDFPDLPHDEAKQSVADVQNKFFGDGNSNLYPLESLRNYYQRASYQQLTIQGNVLGWYRSSKNRAQIDQTTTGRQNLIKEALSYYDAQGHNFAQYDNDNNGTIDVFYVKWTGADNGWANFWWAYQTGWSGTTTYDNKKLGKYVWSWISNPPGNAYTAQVDIHETGHALGLPDLYDYDGTVTPNGGVGGLDMMDGNWGDHNCFSKFMLEWLTPTFIASGSKTLDLNPSGTSKDCVLIMPASTYNPGAMFDEFFMAQYRKRSTGNEPFNYPTDGLTVWHIDSTVSGGNFVYNNSTGNHKYIRLMEADGLEEIDAQGGADAGDFFTTPKTFGPVGSPNSGDYAGAKTGVIIYGLTATGATLGATFSIATGPKMVITSAVLASESCLVKNGVLDPDETVGINFSLQNVGNTSTINLTATLLATGGVAAPSGPQNYGATQPGSPAVSRLFTFVPSGSCGSDITVTLQLQDGSTAYPPVTLKYTLGQLTPMGFYVCCGKNVGDFDGDGDVDQEDYGRMQLCLNGNIQQTDPTCLPGKLNGDTNVNQADVTIFRRCMKGPGVIPDTSCRNP